LNFDDIEEESLKVLQVLYDNPDAVIAVDTETTGLSVASKEHVCIGISIATVIEVTPSDHYFPVQHKVGENVSKPTLDKLKYVLERPGTVLVFVMHSLICCRLKQLGL